MSILVSLVISSIILPATIGDSDSLSFSEKTPQQTMNISESVPTEPIWIYTYDGLPDSDNYFQSVIQCRNGDLAATGGQMTPDSDLNWFTILADSDGGGIDDGQIWTDYAGGAGSDGANAIVQAISNDDLVLAGYYTDSELDIMMRRLRLDASEDWTRVITDPYDQVAYDIVACSDGGFAIAGYVVEGPLWPGEFQIIRTFENGTEKWRQTFGGSRWEEAKALIQCGNGDFLLVGYAQSYGGSDKDLWIVRVNDTGDKIWDQVIDSEFDAWGEDVVECTDGGFAITGSIMNGMDQNLLLTKIDSGGNLEWQQSFGGLEADWGMSLVDIPSGGFAVVGSTESHGSGNSDIWCIRTNNLGDIYWNQTYGGEEADTGNAIITSQGGGLIIAGGTKSWGGSDEDGFLMKIADPPQWIEEPTDKTILYGSGFMYDLNATATHIDMWWLNDTENFLIDNNGLIIAKQIRLAYGIGYYGLQVWVNDTLGNTLTSTFRVILDDTPSEDTLDPIFETTYGGSSDHTSQAIVSCESGGFAIAGTRGLDYDSTSRANITWHHDCSNISGFDQYPSWILPFDSYDVEKQGDIISYGNRINVTNHYGIGTTWHGPIFAHSFNDTFKLGDFKNISLHFQFNNSVTSYMGMMLAYLCDSNFRPAVIFRLTDDYDGQNRGDLLMMYRNASGLYPNYPGFGIHDDLLIDFNGTLRIWLDELDGLKGKVPWSGQVGTIAPLSDLELDREIKYLAIQSFRYQDYTLLPGNIHDIYLEYSADVPNPSPTSPQDDDAWLARLDSIGNLLWNRTYGNGHANKIHSLIECDNGDFLMAGSSWNSSTKLNFWLLRVDSEGNPLWNKTYGGDGNDEALSVVECNDGGFAATGYKYNFTRFGEEGTPGSYDMWLIKTNSSGKIEWNSTYSVDTYAEGYDGGRYHDQKGSCVIECSNGDLLVAGTIYIYHWWNPGLHNLNGFLYRTNSSGDLELNSQFGWGEAEQFSSVEECTNGDFIIIGSTNENDPADVLVCRTDSSSSAGGLIWTEIYEEDGENWGVSIKETTGEFIVLYNSWVGSKGSQDVRLIRISDYGGILWEHEYGGSKFDNGLSISPLEEGGYVVTGFSRSYGMGDSDAWFFIVQPVQWIDIPQDQVIEFGEAFHYSLGCESVSEVGALYGGELFYGNEYKLISNALTWTSARSACISGGGHLVSITSPEENNFVWSLISGSGMFDQWIGINDYYGGEGNWQWVDTNEPVIYTNWASGEPNAAYPEEDFGEIYRDNGLWNDQWEQRFITIYQYYVCEWETGNIDFTWELNDATNFSIAVDTTDIAMADMTNMTQLQAGEYSLNIFVKDSYGDFLNTTINIIVEPHKAPEWVETPINQISEYGEEFEYRLHAKDTGGIESWWVNDTDNFIMNGNLMLNNGTVPKGEYPLLVNVTDVFGNTTTAEFTVTVVDTTPPSFINEPDDQYLQYEEVFLYDIGATDLSGVDQWWINNTTHVNVTTDGTLFQIHTIPVGSHPLQVNVNDTDGNKRSANITVTVSIEPPFWIVEPEEVIAEFAEKFRYPVIAFAPGGFESWWLNDTENFAVNNYGVITNATSLAVGTYGIHLYASDVWGQINDTTFKVTVVDTKAPTWVNIPDNATIEYGGVLEIQLSATDPSGVSHWSVSDTENFAVDSTGHLLSSPEVEPGFYSIMVTVYDIYSNGRSGAITINVTESSAPQWLEVPKNRIAEFGQNFEYKLKADDPSGIGMWWLTDTTSFLIDSEGTITNASFLQVGDYTLTAWVSDLLWNNQSVLLEVHVVDTTPPTFTIPPTNQGLEYREQLELQLGAKDLSGISLWEISDTTLFSITQTGLITNNDLLDVGAHYLEVRVYDPYGNCQNVTIAVIVRSLSPEGISIPLALTIAVTITGGVFILLLAIVMITKKPGVTDAATDASKT